MPPIRKPEDNDSVPRVILYHQTHFVDDKHVSLLPLLHNSVGITHVIIAAIHLNGVPSDITLNNDQYGDPRTNVVWQECVALQAAGIKVLGMLGGAAKGTFRRLDGPSPEFELFYGPLRKMIESTPLQGIDLDIEEEMSLLGVIRLISHLKADFGEDFIITMAPVAHVMTNGLNRAFSSFSYVELEKAVGSHISWYNTQFYNNWGSAETTHVYDQIIHCGWKPRKIVMGLITNPGNGHGYIWEAIQWQTLLSLREMYPTFGGVMGWEYFNSMADDSSEEPWRWAFGMGNILETTREGS
ncbi:MAG: hypothetical protein MMC23_002486 [Stictis urceolatum]|nr:hypothetical protein [Stictis urceolata]